MEVFHVKAEVKRTSMYNVNIQHAIYPYWKPELKANSLYTGALPLDVKCSTHNVFMKSTWLHALDERTTGCET